MVKTIENSEKIIQYLCKKVNDLSKEVKNLKESLFKEKEKQEIKIIPLTFANGWDNYNAGYATGKIIKKGNEWGGHRGNNRIKNRSDRTIKKTKGLI